jgi:alkylation response protein AidB-like acyl-CoA dehydrogenase
MALVAPNPTAAALHQWWQRQRGTDPSAFMTEQPQVAAAMLQSLAKTRAIDVPFPGSGHTRQRFDALAALGEMDLTIARLAEAHTDAIAILHELGSDLADGPADSVWAVWAAEPPSARLSAVATVDGTWQLSGRKAWCSGAGGSSHALVTAHADDGPRLFAVDLGQREVQPVDDPWPTPALTGTDTRSVDFFAAVATAVGAPGDYVNRPGFWHGAVGVSAVWYGGAVGVARKLLGAGLQRPLGDIELAHLGAVGAALAGAYGSLVTAADAFDADPSNESKRVTILARTTRAVVEAAATDVIDRVGRALGAAPLALDATHSRRVLDLQLYLRQSHADRDLADLGGRMVARGDLW